MNNYKKVVLAIATSLGIYSCQHNQEARRPISQATGSFMKKSAERNKKLIASEESRIDSLIKNNPKVTYLASTKGYWYTYIQANTTDTLTPKKGDIAFFDYEIKSLSGKIIYSQNELRPQTYTIDKQNIMSGLREGIKIMHKNEKICFLFPSHIAYGFHGDDKKIGPNEPLLCTVNLHHFINETAFKKDIHLQDNHIETLAPKKRSQETARLVSNKKDSLAK